MKDVQVIDDSKYEYSEACLSLPYCEKRVEELVEKMLKWGWDKTDPILIWEGFILDGRHRYEAAQIANVEPTYEIFTGTPEKAWDKVEVVNDVNGNRPITPEDRSVYIVRRMNALGVRKDGSHKRFEEGRPNGTATPTLKDHAKAAGVSERTAKRENAHRKEVFENPDNSDLAAMATTAEGYKEAKKEANKRKTFNEMLEDGDIVPQENNLPVWFNGKNFNAFDSATAVLVGAANLYCSGGETDKDLKRFLGLASTVGEAKERDDYKIVALLKMRDAINDIEDDLLEYLGVNKEAKH